MILIFKGRIRSCGVVQKKSKLMIWKNLIWVVSWLFLYFHLVRQISTSFFLIPLTLEKFTITITTITITITIITTILLSHDGWNPNCRELKWKLLGSTFLWYFLTCFTECMVLTFESVLWINPQLTHYLSTF